MTWTNGIATLHHGDARDIPLEDQSVHCVVTSSALLGASEVIGLGDWEFGDLVDHEREAAIVLLTWSAMNLPDNHATVLAQQRPVGYAVRCRRRRESVLSRRLPSTLPTSWRSVVRSGECCGMMARSG